MKKILYIIFIFLLLYSSCKTDFEINAEWKDITIVYGLLDQTEKTHYIKINKAFLGEENALLMATEPDSCTYGNNLDVWLEEWINNSLSNLWTLDTTTVYNKEPGIFYYPEQVLYKFYADTLYENAEYRLFIKNNNTGKIVSSKTSLVHFFSITKPTSFQAVNFTASNPVDVKWNSAYNGKLYNIIIRFKYKEKNIVTNDSIIKSLDWNLGNYKADNIDGGETMTTSYYGANFYKFLHDNIPETPNVIRNASGFPLEFIFSVAADEFNTYMEVNAPSNGVIQERPEYTNISNGIGLFSARYHNVRSLYMSALSMDSLKNGQYTKNLNFE